MMDAGDFTFEQLGPHTLKVERSSGRAWVLAATGFDFFWSEVREMTEEERQAERRRSGTRTQPR